MSPDCDVVVIGGGSGGFGAALAAARRGLRVALVERSWILGGTSTLAGVNTWEPGCSGPGLPAELYRRLVVRPRAIGVSRTVKSWEADRPWGLSRIDRSRSYRDSLRRSGLDRTQLTRVTFEPDAMAAEMAAMLAETVRVALQLCTRCVAVETESGRITAVRVRSAGGERRITAAYFVDATADVDVARFAGCRTYFGCEPKSTYDEPGAPPRHADELNGATLVYRVGPADRSATDPPQARGELDPFEASASITEYPVGDLCVNVLPVLQGIEYARLGPEEGYAEARRRVLRHWAWLRDEKGFGDYQLQMLFPVMGVREGPRLVGREVLTQHDVRSGAVDTSGASRIVALNDHPLDTHGRGGGVKELDAPHGVPYECLLPQEYENLIVASRGASFSHLAASSCRLSRTMMCLGHAAGLACAAAAERKSALGDVNVRRVREWLDAEGVALSPDDPRLRRPGA